VILCTHARTSSSEPSILLVLESQAALKGHVRPSSGTQTAGHEREQALPRSRRKEKKRARRFKGGPRRYRGFGEAARGGRSFTLIAGRRRKKVSQGSWKLRVAIADYLQGAALALARDRRDRRRNEATDEEADRRRSVPTKKRPDAEKEATDEKTKDDGEATPNGRFGFRSTIRMEPNSTAIPPKSRRGGRPSRG